MKLGETGEKGKRCTRLEAEVEQQCILTWQRSLVHCVCALPGEAEEDVNDDGSQLYTLFPVLPQYSGQST